MTPNADPPRRTIEVRPSNCLMGGTRRSSGRDSQRYSATTAPRGLSSKRSSTAVVDLMDRKVHGSVSYCNASFRLKKSRKKRPIRLRSTRTNRTVKAFSMKPGMFKESRYSRPRGLTDCLLPVRLYSVSWNVGPVTYVLGFCVLSVTPGAYWTGPGCDPRGWKPTCRGLDRGVRFLQRERGWRG